jgi:curved DNA-binding protein CbpA
MQGQDYYQILQVSYDSTITEVKESFRRLARQHHPDLHPGDAEAEERFKQICEAYNVLSDPDLRYRYDQQHPRSQPKTNAKTQTKRNPDQTGTKPPSQSSSSSFQRLYHQGLEAATQREYAKALGYFTQALTLNPNYWEAYLERAQIYYIQSNDRGALEDCTQVLQRNPQSSQAYYLQGRARHRLGFLAEAVGAYSQAIAYNAAYPQAYYYRGAAHLELQSFTSAVSDFETAKDLYYTQRDSSGYNLSVEALAKLKRNRGDLLAGVRGVVQDLLTALSRYFPNPSGNLLTVFARLDANRAARVGVGLSLMAQACFVLGSWLVAERTSTVDSVGDWFTVVLGLSFVPLFSLVLMIVGCRFFTKQMAAGRNSWQKDLFVAGATLLPMGLGYLLGLGLTANYPLLFAASIAFAGCHAMLTLYSGLSQVHHFSETQATWLVPTLLVLTVAVTYGCWQGLF